MERREREREKKKIQDLLDDVKRIINTKLGTDRPRRNKDLWGRPIKKGK